MEENPPAADGAAGRARAASVDEVPLPELSADADEPWASTGAGGLGAPEGGASDVDDLLDPSARGDGEGLDEEDTSLDEDGGDDDDDDDDPDDDDDDDGPDLDDDEPEEEEDSFDALLSGFVGITGAARGEAQAFLEASDWDVERAVELFYTDEDGARAGGRDFGDDFAASAADFADGDDLFAEGADLADDADFLATADAPEPRNASRDAADDEAVASRGFVRRWLFALKRLLTTKESPVGREAALAFARDYDMKYDGVRRPQFFADGYREAAASARRQSKTLLVYLHSPLHSDTPDFCRGVLADDTFLAFAQRSCVLWAADACESDGYSLADALGVTTFPFVAVLLCRSGGEEVVDRVQGFSTPDELVPRLGAAIAVHEEHLTRTRLADRERTESTRLRREQDSEYEQALDADRKRDDAAAVQQKIDAEEAEALRLAEDLAAALELSQAQAKEASLKRKRDNLGPEPAAGPGAARLRLQFPNGTKIDRRFQESQPLQCVRDFIELHLDESGVAISSYSLSTNYPRTEISAFDVSLKESNLSGKVLYIQDLDA